MQRLQELLPEVKKVIKSGDLTEWDSLVINRRKPHTYRVFRQFGDLRVCLHKFEECAPEDAFAHPHPWSGAFLMLEGAYVHEVGFSPDLESQPVFCFKEIVYPYSRYEITNKQTWHKVQPLKTTYTIMCNTAAWEGHSETRTTKGKDLEKMTDVDLTAHLQKFDELLNDYSYSLISGS